MRRDAIRMLQLYLSLCTVLMANAQADNLGQLFTSPLERARIDALRAGMRPQQETASATAARVVVNGTLRGSDGKRLVWLNGAAINPSSADNMTLLGDGRVKFNWREGTRTLKPGQGIDQSSGEVFEYHTPVPVAPAPTATASESPGAPAPARPVAEGKEKAATDTVPVNAPEAKAKKS